MRALAMTKAEAGHAEIIEMPRPRPGKGEVLIEVLACGICGTDMTLYSHPQELAQQMGIEFPIVFGHEFGGRVVELGEGVTEPPLGSLVTANPHLFCGECLYCRTDRHEICINRPIVGYNRSGGFAQYVAVRASNVYRLNDDVPPAVSALGEPLALGRHLAARAEVGPEDEPVIFGPGPIGLVTALGCQSFAPRRVTLVGLPQDEERLAIARSWGVETLHSDGPALRQLLYERSEGYGPAKVFECSGSGAALRQALELVRKDGTVFAVGIPSKDVPLDIAALVFAERRIVGCRGYRPQDWQSAAQLINERHQELLPLVSDLLPLAVYDAGFAKAFAKTGIRIMLEPGS